jgi:uncharacterized Zn finger protein
MVGDSSFWDLACQRYPSHAARIRRGRDLLAAHLADVRAGVIVARVEGDKLSFRVRSQSNGRGEYRVDGQGCTCPDWPASHRCKHFVAVSVLAQVIGARLA